MASDLLCKCGKVFYKFSKLIEHMYEAKDGSGKHLRQRSFKAEEVKENNDD